MLVASGLLLCGLFSALGAGRASAQDDQDHQEDQEPVPPEQRPSLLELHFTPTSYAQIALWIEDEAGTFLATVGLTDAVALRGIGNRPGASQMNSGFRWPYGRREGVLPVWAHRRASAPGAKQFRRVIFQDRKNSAGEPAEGYASRSSSTEASRDDYFCLSFDTSRSQKDALDAVSCASVFSSDKGRFITEQDVAQEYAEPFEDTETGEGRLQTLPLHSPYPPRRDAKVCRPACDDSEDQPTFDAHTREVMPEIDAVTMATPPGGKPMRVLFTVPDAWQAGEYRACVEINVEGDYNEVYNAETLPTPKTPADRWDSWAVGLNYGYPYRGQPSVVYCAPFTLGEDAVTESSVERAEGSVASWETFEEDFGELHGMDTMTDDPVGAPGSGADRLELSEDGYRLKVVVKPPLECRNDEPPSTVQKLSLSHHPDEQEAHHWARMTFRAADDDQGIYRYEVRVSTEPIVDEASFMRGVPAKNASVEAEELRVPVDALSGEMVRASFGGLIAQTHYYVGVRAIDACAQASAIQVAEIETKKRVFATVSPCFVATAAYGSAMGRELSALRAFRDRFLASHAPGQALLALYWEVGPRLARLIANDEPLRVVSRALLSPFVAVARFLSEAPAHDAESNAGSGSASL